MSICLCVFMCDFVLLCLSLCVCVCFSLCLCISLCLCFSLFVFVFMCVCVPVFVCVYLCWCASVFSEFCVTMRNCNSFIIISKFQAFACTYVFVGRRAINHDWVGFVTRIIDKQITQSQYFKNKNLRNQM